MRAIVRSFARLTNIGRDGEECCALEIPRKIVEFVVADEKLGEGQGLIGILNKGRVDRQEGVHDAGYQDKPHLLGKWFCK